MANLLLDTHAFIWYAEDDPQLPESLKEQINNADRVYLSIASLWEIAIKLSIGKLSLGESFESIGNSLEPAGISLLPITFADTVRVMNLPLHHRDPFDRIIIAQAMNNSLALISCDRVFAAYAENIIANIVANIRQKYWIGSKGEEALRADMKTIFTSKLKI